MSDLLTYLIQTDDSFANPARLTSLYSDFSILKSSNPDGYNANILAWRAALEEGTRAGLVPGGRFSIKVGKELEAKLESRGHGRPVALGAVVHDSLTSKTMIPLAQFLTSKSSPLGTSWLPSVHIPSLADIARWGLQQVGLSGGSGSFVDGEFVLVANVKDAAQQILNTVSESSTGNVFTLPSFHSYAESALAAQNKDTTTQRRKMRLSASDVDVLLKYLTRDINAAVVAIRASPVDSRETVTVVKLTKPGAKVTPVSETDVSIATLSALSASLAAQIKTMSERMEQLEKDAKQYAKEAATNPASKSRAISILRMKNVVSSTLSKRLDSQSNVESTLLKLEEAVSNVEIVAALDMSATVMKNVNKRIGGVDRVDKVMDSVKEASDDVDEIARALGEDTAGVIDEADIEDELATLQEATRGQTVFEPVEPSNQKVEQEQEATLQLPSVPKREPSLDPAKEAEPDSKGGKHEDGITESKKLEEQMESLAIGESSK